MLLLRHKLNRVLGVESARGRKGGRGGLGGMDVEGGGGEEGVRIVDILYLRGKDSKSNAKRPKGKGRVVPYKKIAEQSQRVREFFQSAAFKEANALDYEFVALANKMLDREVSPFLGFKVQGLELGLTLRFVLFYSRVQICVYLSLSISLSQRI